MAFFNTKDAGPIVVEVPPADDGGSLNANFVDVWQVPLEDAGLYGIDKGAGVKFLILPPGYSGTVPPGYTALRPATFGSYALLRSNLKSHGDADVAKSDAYGKRVIDGGKTYRLTVPANPPVEQYWSATVYDRATHALVRDLPRASRSSQIPERQKNADGSVDVYIGPTAPAGKESN